MPFGTDNEKLLAVSERLSKFLAASEHFVSDSASKPFVTIYSIEDSRLTLLIECFVSENTWGAELTARQVLAIEVAKIFEETDVHFAFPTQTIFVQTKPGLD